MPTAHSYWRAAVDFARLAAVLADEAAAVRRSLTDEVVVGGRLRPTLDEAVEMIVSGAGATAEDYDVLAAECRRRALACEAYTAALRAGAPPATRPAWITPG